MAMFKEAADIKTSDQLNLPVPQAKFETVVVKPSEIQQDMVQALSERAAEVHSGSVDPSVDNMLKITSDGRKIGLDQRLMNSALPDDPSSKLNACVNNVLRIWNDTKEQMIASTLRHENYLKESIANISHDLRTPLTVILGHLQLLRKETLTDKQEQRIETIFHKAERMKELVQTFYDLSILDAEQITPRREDFNLSNLLINLITENAPALEAKNISPEIDLPPHSVYLNSDYSMVERILQNLLTNAIRYSSGDIKMGLKQTRKNRAIFTIENPIDSKTEINPARLFERFYTGDASRHNSGTGIGLAVVKLLTDKLGGNVSAEIKSNVLTVTLEIH